MGIEERVFRANSEEPQNDKFFTSEGTPIRRMNTFFQLDSYKRTQTRQITKILQDLDEKKKAQYSPIFSNVACMSFNWILAIFGTGLVSASLVFDLSYIATQTFSSEGIYAFYCFAIGVRFIGPLLNMVRYYYTDM